MTLPVLDLVKNDRPVLSMKDRTIKRKPTFREVLDSLKPEQARQFECDLYYICIAYYMGKACDVKNNWHIALNRAKNKFKIGSRKIVMEYLEILDGEMIDLISNDFIGGHYRKKATLQLVK